MQIGAMVNQDGALQVCDPKGRINTTDGTCVCKTHVAGTLCNECKSGTFYLSERNPDGCLKCFCMGVTKQCSSSYWNRDQVRSTYDSLDRVPFSISNAGSTRTFSEGIRVTGPSELTFNSFNIVPQDVYFWVLPDRFKGDKVTSYGGELRYTITFEAPTGSHPLHSQPDVVLQGNGIFLEHYASTRTAPGYPITITVPFRERAWRRTDGQDATREHLLMALASIDLLMIRASYAERMSESRISNIHMDVAVPHSTNRQRAVEVEHCECPAGYTGPSCQDCTIGYTRSTSGLYLGTCEPCQCGGHSTECDGETGECQNCQHNSEGPKCERCRPGFYGDATRGTPGDCQPCPCQRISAQYFGTCFLDQDGYPTCDSCPVGYAGRQCERCAPGYRGDPSRGQQCVVEGSTSCPCDLRGSSGDRCDSRRQCVCKSNVEGLTCSSCRPHHFHLSEENPDGCLPCFCMGVTQQCTSSNYHRELITSPFLPGNFQNFALVNRQHSTRITSGFVVEMSRHGPQMSYGGFDQLGQESYYWQLPEGYQGDKQNESSLTEEELRKKVAVGEMKESSPSRARVRRQTKVLDCDAPTWASPFLLGFSKTCEILGTNGYRCTACQAGYTGQYCERCAPGYTGSPNIHGQKCVPEDSRSKLLVKIHPQKSIVSQGSGVTLRCQVSGNPPYYFFWSREDGRPLPGSAQPRQDGEELHFSRLQPSDSGIYICTCRNPESANTSRAEIYVSAAPTKPITVTVEEQKIQRVRQGSDVTFICTAKSKSPAYTLVWTRQNNGKLPDRAMDFNGILTIRKVRPEDAGIYICTGSNMFDMDEGNATLVLQTQMFYGPYETIEGHHVTGSPTAPNAVIEPRQLTVQRGQPAEFRCTATGHPTPSVEWTGGPNGVLSSRAIVQGGILRFPSVEQSDEGQYTCRVHNSVGHHIARADLRVHSGSLPDVQSQTERTDISTLVIPNISVADVASGAIPAVRIESSSDTIIEGQTVDLNCVSNYPYHGGYLAQAGRKPLLPNHQAHGSRLRILQVHCRFWRIHLPIYQWCCHPIKRPSSSPSPVAQANTVTIENVPAIRIEPSSDTLVEGQTLELNCVFPSYPNAVVTWHRSGHPLSHNHQVSGSRLRILQASVEDSGEYICRVTSGTLTYQASIMVTIQSHGSTSSSGSSPAVRIDSSSRSVAEGQTLDLNCVVAGQPNAEVTLHRAGRPLSPNHQVVGSRLRIMKASVADSGEYICRATTGSTTRQASITVTITHSGGAGQSSAITPTIRIESASDSVSEGQTVVLNCVIEGQQSQEVTWYRPGHQLAPNHQISGSRLRIVHASPKDSGEYICRINSGSGVQMASIMVSIEGSSLSEYWQYTGCPIRIESSSERVEVGQTVELNCLADPGTVVTWHRSSGLPLSSNHQVSGSRLRILQASPADSGIYICRVSTSSGFRDASITVRVHSSRPTISFTDPIEKSSDSISEGQTLDLNCIVVGKPNAPVTWHRNGASFSSNQQISGSRLRIVQASTEDSGEYVCRYSTDTSVQTATITVSILSGAASSYRLQSPVISIDPHSATVRQGENATFKCRVHDGAPPITLTWQMGPNHPMQENVHISADGSTITIVGAHHKNQGSYRCMASNLYGMVHSSVNLMVQGRPTVSVLPHGPIRINVGDPVNVECMGIGDPRPIVSWRRTGSRQNLKQQNPGPPDSRAVLQIPSAKKEDSGFYTCVGQNPAGSTQVQVEVYVEHRLISPGAPTVLGDRPIHVVAAGGTATLSCMGEGNPTPTITWSKLRAPLPWQHKVVNNTLIIPNVAQQDSGKYICNASNSQGHAEVYITLDVEVPPYATSVPHEMSVNVGEPVHIQCLAHGTSPLQFEWNKVGGSLPEQSSVESGVLRIKSASLGDGGTYRCVVSNKVGHSEAFAQVSISGEGVATGRPTVSVVPHGPVRVTVGDPINLDCVGTGDPRPVLSWHRTGDRQRLKPQNLVPLDHHAVLQILSARPEDSGSYTCIAQNPSGSTLVQVEVHVESRVIRPGAPKVTVQKPVHIVVAGGRAVLTCTAVGNPTPTISWSKLRAPLPWQHQVVNNTLIIPKVALQDSGQYICNASNAEGFSEIFITLDVETPPYATTLPDEVSASVGEVIQIQCLAQGTSPLNFHWSKVNGSLPNQATVRESVLHINLAREEDSGTYRCVVRNKVGESEAFAQVSVVGPFAVRVSPKTSTKAVSGTAEFTCSVTGDPRARIQWIKDGGHLPPGHSVEGGVLRIPSLEFGNEGTYTCRVSSRFGQVQESVKLVLQALPKVRINIRTSVQTVLAGNSVELNVWPLETPGHTVPQIAAHPEMKEITAGSTAVFPGFRSEITWDKLEGELPSNHRIENNVLTIPNVKAEDAGTYVCTAANRQGRVNAFSMLKVRERVVPYFDPITDYGPQSSHLPYQSKKFEIRITFRPDTADALVLYSGMLVTVGRRKARRGFFSWVLVGGSPEFGEFDAGSGMAKIRYPTPLTLGDFHTVTLYRNLTEGSLVVDKQAPVNGTSQGKFQGLDLNEELFLGGYPNYDSISKSGLNSGFVGCVRQLIIQGEEVIFRDFDLSASGLSTCPTCRDRPCKNRGICHDSESSNYVCDCPSGFTGSNCEHSQALHCHPEACGPDATCINRATASSTPPIIISYGIGVMVNTLSFDGETPSSPTRPLTNIHYELRVDMDSSSLLSRPPVLQRGKADPVGIFVSLAMGTALEFRYELGSVNCTDGAVNRDVGIAILTSDQPLTLGQWHKVSAERVNKDGTLQVDDRPPVKRSSPGKSQGLNLKTLMYLGGVESSVSIPSAANVSRPFQGCIGEVTFLESLAIGQCYDNSPCDRMPCLHGGRCLPTGEYEYQCLCQDGFRGDRCETHEDRCQIHNPCLNGGTCKDNRCHCPSGFSGTICELGRTAEYVEREWPLEGSGGNDAPGHYGYYFSNDSFIVLPRHVFPKSNTNSPEIIELELRTLSTDGVILWQGMCDAILIFQEENKQGKEKDFVSLGLKGGHLVFSYQLGSGEANILSEDPVNDGEWHKIVAFREGKSGSIQIDGEELVSGVSPGDHIMKNTMGSIYLGGAPM
ncbi:hypothetical protein GDO86_019022 [Hymenochirus boettgeri]|uniref:Basement membrane-specific heparan sulfate proteoglycan core protein n=1 Tax=Hymenochirus boettgeri TaxID=247094 RepID=A0A8T2IKK5_9PIPI|nr:hypothetical protein GDO86_019022 [Hymenochirus boettgeri]